MMTTTRTFSIFFILLLFCTSVGGKEFVVVIDAGHGGKDPGAIGRLSREKDINLSVALKLGKQIKNNCKDVRVVYTRSTDVFIPLERRAEIANDHKADLFISIHTNSVASKSNSPQGASTWTLGLARSSANLEVAKRENAVILYESDYKTRYAGFNPNSAESYIIFEFMQDKYMSQSVHLADLVQKQFKGHARRTDRGIHQAGFLVLKASAMPSILVELGFISNATEECYLNTEDGQNTLSASIYRAFLTYKREQEIRLTGASQTVIPTAEKKESPIDSTTKEKEAPQPESPQPTVAAPSAHPTATSTNEDAPTFTIQLLVSGKPLPLNDRQFKGLKDVQSYKENGMYKYTYGADKNYNTVLRTKRSIQGLFKDAFIIAFSNGEKMNVNEAIRMFKAKK